MKGNPEVIKALQEVLTKELVGINQYFIHAKKAANWGYHRLAKHEWDESMDEMRHADKVIERMLFLEADPNMGRYEKVLSAEDPKKILEYDLDLELRAIAVLDDSIKICFEHADHGTRELLEHILVDEQEHVDWIEAQLEKIETLGYKNWLAHQQFGEGEG